MVRNCDLREGLCISTGDQTSVEALMMLKRFSLLPCPDVIIASPDYVPSPPWHLAEYLCVPLKGHVVPFLPKCCSAEASLFWLPDLFAVWPSLSLVLLMLSSLPQTLWSLSSRGSNTSTSWIEVCTQTIPLQMSQVQLNFQIFWTVCAGLDSSLQNILKRDPNDRSLTLILTFSIFYFFPVERNWSREFAYKLFWLFSFQVICTS